MCLYAIWGYESCEYWCIKIKPFLTIDKVTEMKAKETEANRDTRSDRYDLVDCKNKVNNNIACVEKNIDGPVDTVKKGVYRNCTPSAKAKGKFNARR